MEEDPDSYIIEFERMFNHEFPHNLIPNGKKYDWRKVQDQIYFYKYNQYAIWGFTAKMTKNFIDIIKSDS